MKYTPSLMDKMANIDKLKMSRNALAMDVSERAENQHAEMLSKMKRRKLMAANRKKEKGMVASASDESNPLG
jgi:hypothetical protein